MSLWVPHKSVSSFSSKSINLSRFCTMYLVSILVVIWLRRHMVCWVGTNILDKHRYKSAKLVSQPRTGTVNIWQTYRKSTTRSTSWYYCCPKIFLPELAIRYGGHTHVQDHRLCMVITTTEWWVNNSFIQTKRCTRGYQQALDRQWMFKYMAKSDMQSLCN